LIKRNVQKFGTIASAVNVFQIPLMLIRYYSLNPCAQKTVLSTFVGHSDGFRVIFVFGFGGHCGVKCPIMFQDEARRKRRKIGKEKVEFKMKQTSATEAVLLKKILAFIFE